MVVIVEIMQHHVRWSVRRSEQVSTGPPRLLMPRSWCVVVRIVSFLPKELMCRPMSFKLSLLHGLSPVGDWTLLDLLGGLPEVSLWFMS